MVQFVRREHVGVSNFFQTKKIGGNLSTNTTLVGREVEHTNLCGISAKERDIISVEAIIGIIACIIAVLDIVISNKKK